jgi:[histone H3]-lysine36 N-dimethyltransferase SETMAR
MVRVEWIIHWEILPNGCTIIADLYCQQLDRFAEKLQGKQDRKYFSHDNAELHIAKSTREKVLKPGWVAGLHPLYSLNLAPTVYHLFRSLSNNVSRRKFDEKNDLEMDLLYFFDQEYQG